MARRCLSGSVCARALHVAGAIRARTVLFVWDATVRPSVNWPRPRCVLSRHALDALLAETFQQLGGELRVTRAGIPRARWRGPRAVPPGGGRKPLKKVRVGLASKRMWRTSAR